MQRPARGIGVVRNADGPLYSQRWATIELLCLLLGAAATFLTGCERCFVIRGNITDDSTGKAVAGAKAILVMDQGYAGPNQVVKTDSSGQFAFRMNEPPRAWATLTVEHSNYHKWSTQFRGAPTSEVGVRLVPRAQP